MAYPEKSAYRSEIAGLMEALRVLNIDQSAFLYWCAGHDSCLIYAAVRNYHSKYYVPQNLGLIVAGKFLGGTEELLSVVQEKVEPTIVNHGQNGGPRPRGWSRPFLETPSAIREPFRKDISSVVEFPEKDESVGELLIVFMGPPMDQYLERQVLPNQDP